jgi:anti-anti-sigma factor
MSEIAYEEINGWLIVRFTSPSLTEPMMLERVKQDLDQRLAELPKGAKVLISFKGVEFVSSQIIGLMLSSKDAVMRQRKGTFALARLGNNIRDVLRLTKLDSQFKIAETETEIVGRRRRDPNQRGDDLSWMD